MEGHLERLGPKAVEALLTGLVPDGGVCLGTETGGGGVMAGQGPELREAIDRCAQAFANTTSIDVKRLVPRTERTVQS